MPSLPQCFGLACVSRSLPNTPTPPPPHAHTQLLRPKEPSPQVATQAYQDHPTLMSVQLAPPSAAAFPSPPVQDTKSHKFRTSRSK